MPGMFSNLFRKGVFIMKDLKGSKTEANLLAAFAGESQARNKYTYYASKARKDGYVQIAEIFEETANNEKEHAKIWFKILKGGEIPDTATNLQDGVDGYKKLLDNVKGECVFSKDGDVIWQCINCGHIVIGKKAPAVCPVCAHPQAYFQVKPENY